MTHVWQPCGWSQKPNWENYNCEGKIWKFCHRRKAARFFSKMPKISAQEESFSIKITRGATRFVFVIKSRTTFDFWLNAEWRVWSILPMKPAIMLVKTGHRGEHQQRVAKSFLSGKLAKNNHFHRILLSENTGPLNLARHVRTTFFSRKMPIR